MSILDRSHTVAGPGYSKWLIPPAALAVHLSIGQVYAFSVFKTSLVAHFGTSQTPIAWIFSIAIVMLGLSAAVLGTWVEREGPRKAMVAAALCWSVWLPDRLARDRHHPAVAPLPRVRRDRRHGLGDRLHLPGLDPDQVVPRPPRARHRHGHHGVRRWRADRLAPCQLAARLSVCDGRFRPRGTPVGGRRGTRSR